MKSSVQTTWLHIVASYIGAGYLHLIGKTSQVLTVDHPASLSLRREKKPTIYALWHNQQVFLSYHHRGEGAAIMVSRSNDGEYIAQVMKRMGLPAVRGSSSRGGQQAFRQMLEILKAGGQVGFTPDGPKGPVHSIHDGIVAAARVSGVPIVPVAVRSRREIRFKSWDGFRLPLPFNTIVVSHGPPLTIAANIEDESARLKIREALFQNEERAEHGLAGAPSLGSAMIGFLLSGLYLALGWLSIPIWIPVALVIYGWSRSKKSLVERLSGGAVPETDKPRLWFHAASLGEWQALRPLLKKFENRTDVSVFVTASTPEARKIISQQEPNLPLSILPLDLGFLMDRFIKRVKPAALILIETEMWPRMIGCCYRSFIPVFIANGRLSNSSVRGWQIVKPLAQRFLAAISWFFVRSTADGKNFCELGAPLVRLSVTGNLKNDSLHVWSWEEKARRRKDLFPQADGLIVVAGSTWPGEEAAALRLLGKSLPKKIRLILAPRRPERFKEVEKILESHPVSWSRWSLVKSIGGWNTDVLLVDTLGDLKELYATADIALLGGSLYPRGGQNPLEAAASRLALLYGPHMENFKEESADLKKYGAARQVRTVDEFTVDAIEIVGDDSLRRSMAEAAAGVVLARQGAVDRTVRSLLDLMGLKG